MSGRWCGLLALGLVACGAAAPQAPSALLEQQWTNDGGRSIEAAQRRLAGVTLPDSPGYVLGLTASGVSVKSLDRQRSWQSVRSFVARPVIAGNVVVGLERGALLALDARTGQPLWSLPVAQRHLLGAGDDAALTAVGLAASDEHEAELVVVDRQGKVALRLTAPPAMGAPGVLGGLVFLPWGNQYVSVLDPNAQREVGRALLRVQVSTVQPFGGRLWFGERAMVRFDDKIGGASRGAATLARLPEVDLPGNPTWFPERAAPAPLAATGRDAIRIYARPGEEGGFDADRYAASYRRLLLGADAASGELRFVQVLPAVALGGAAVEGGFVLCAEDGSVHLLESAGGTASGFSFGTPLQACVVSAGDFVMPRGAASASLPEQLGKAVALGDADLVPAQRYLMRALAASADPKVTQVLIALAMDGRTPPSLIDETRRLLSQRRNGADAMIAALSREVDFLSDVTRPPPVGPLADALAALGDPRAAPLLARHLNDPVHSTGDLARVSHALFTLATSAEYEPLRTFFALYRATAEDDSMVAAVLDVARALQRIGGAPAAQLIARALQDPLTVPAIKSGLEQLPATPPAAAVPPAAPAAPADQDG